jgi:flagellar L-ring protein precursor FlgH
MRHPAPLAAGLAALALLAACSDLADVGQVPEFTETQTSYEVAAMSAPGLPELIEPEQPFAAASTWTKGRGSLLGDRRAGGPGDILTVVIDIDEGAAISNSSNRSRSGSQSMGVPQFFGIPQRLDESLPDGASLSSAVEASSASSSAGDGSVVRNETLTLRVAATVVSRLPSGVLQIQGSQEVRVNFEIRELIVTGYVRPEDISRQNEVTYDKIASARISYGGRGQISDVQQPRYGQQIADILLPF